MYEKQDREKPFGRPRRRLENNIKIEFKLAGWDFMDCFDPA
jgi:hypothetical protein